MSDASHGTGEDTRATKTSNADVLRAIAIMAVFFIIIMLMLRFAL